MRRWLKKQLELRGYHQYTLFTKEMVSWDYVQISERRIRVLYKKGFCCVNSVEKRCFQHWNWPLCTDWPQKNTGRTYRPCWIPCGPRALGWMQRSLTDVEKSYAQIECEVSAVLYGLQKMHLYIYSHHVTITTDYKPLLGMFTKSSQRIELERIALHAQDLMTLIPHMNQAMGILLMGCPDC